MPTEEEVRLTLKTAGFDAMKGIASDATKAAETYQVLATAGEGFEIEERRVASAMDLAVQAAVEQTQAQKALNAALEDSTQKVAASTAAVDRSAAASKGAAKAKNQFGFALQSAAYATQDFTSQLGTRGLAGALGAVQNNIPILVTQLGGAAGLAGAIGIVAVGVGLLYENWGKVAALWSPDETAKLPILGAGLDEIAKSLKGINSEIEDLEKRSLTEVLSHPDVVRLEKLRGLRSEGQKQEADLRLVEGIGERDDKRSREIAAAVKAAIAEAGGGGAVASTLKGNIGGSYQEAVAIVAGALRGNTADLDLLKVQSPRFGREFNRVDPDLEAKRKQAAKAFGEEKAHIEARTKANENTGKADEKAAAEQARTVEQLNDEGRANEAEWKRGIERDAAKQARNEAADREKAEAASQPSARLRAFHAEAQERAAGIALAENNGEFAPAQLQSIAREAAANAGGLDVDSIRQAVYQAAAMTRMKAQADLNRLMQRMNVQSDSYVSPY